MITENAEQFTVDVSNWAEKCKGRLKTFATEFIQDLNDQIIRATPVKTGFLRGSWWSALNGDPAGMAIADPSGGLSVARVNLVANELRLGDTYNMANGAAYAARVEFGFIGTDSLGRHYHQQPRSFVRGTLDRAQEIADAAAERVANL